MLRKYIVVNLLLILTLIFVATILYLTQSIIISPLMIVIVVVIESISLLIYSRKIEFRSLGVKSILIKQKKIKKQFDDFVLFEDFSIEVGPGEFIGIYGGESGSGKTIMNILGLIEDYDAGQIKYRITKSQVL